MGKTPAQQNRLKAKQQGMSHDDVKKQQSKEAHEIKKLKNKDMDFGRAAGLKTKDQVAAQRLKDMNDPTTELGKATMRAARKAAKEQEEFLLRTKGISIRQKEVPEGVDPKTILCEYFKHGCCAKSADRCKFSHKMPDASRSGGSDATRKRDIYEDDEADEGDTMELWDQAKLESVIAKKHGAEKASSNATDIVCKHFLAAVETRKYGWFWACPGGDACKYKHKLPKGYVFKSDLVAMMREAALNRKSDQDDLREALEKLKDSGPGTPVTLEVFLDWKTRRVEARKEREAKAREERQKKGKFTGRELCESKDMTHASDEGSAQDDAEFKELRRLRKLAEEEEEARGAGSRRRAREGQGERPVVRRGGARVRHLHRRAREQRAARVREQRVQRLGGGGWRGETEDGRRETQGGDSPTPRRRRGGGYRRGRRRGGRGGLRVRVAVAEEGGQIKGRRGARGVRGGGGVRVEEGGSERAGRVVEAGRVGGRGEPGPEGARRRGGEEGAGGGGGGGAHREGGGGEGGQGGAQGGEEARERAKRAAKKAEKEKGKKKKGDNEDDAEEA